jgi:hypothetical protein
MTNPGSLPFEEEVRAASDVPAPRAAFVEDLWRRIERAPRTSRAGATRVARPRHLRPAWIGLSLLLAAFIITILVVGPIRVYAEFRRLLGYIPSVGIVDQSAPIRVLAEPVSQTRDGITITVTSATLTADVTHIEYRIFGVPRSAYPDREDVHGCFAHDYLLLPDGTQLEGMQDYPPLPANVAHALLVIPCIGETLPGRVPENWALPLRFVPAPAELTVMPVIELSPLAETTRVPAESAVSFDQVIETSDGYILLGRFTPRVAQGEWAQVTGMPQIHDATGARVSYNMPNDVQEPMVSDGSGGFGFAYEFDAAGIAYPLTISFPGVIVGPADPQASAQFHFDTGEDPQPDQVWTLNQQVELAGHTITLVSVSTAARNGYAFEFQSDEDFYSLSLEIDGHPANGGGGGGVTGGTLHASLDFIDVPTGPLTLNVSNLVVIKSRTSWEGEWTPAEPRTDLPSEPTAQAGLCLTAASVAGLTLAPTDLGGRVTVYEPLEGEAWGIVMYDLAAGTRRVLVQNAARGALSPDGATLAYGGEGGMHLMDLSTGQEQVFPLATLGYDLRFSRDGRMIAYIGATADGAYLVNADGSGERRISDASYSSIIGFSPDGARLYLAVMYTGGSAWMVRAVDLATGEARDLATIENGSYKMLAARLSPDEQWIAYRGRDNSTLYVMHPDGSAMHTVMEQPALAIGGVEWTGSGWLGVSLIQDDTSSRVLVIVRPETCQAYRLPLERGDLEGLWIP